MTRPSSGRTPPPRTPGGQAEPAGLRLPWKGQRGATPPCRARRSWPERTPRSAPSGRCRPWRPWSCA
eukprot:4957730-Alexandrium_andersonii.AAC.1